MNKNTFFHLISSVAALALAGAALAGDGSCGTWEIVPTPNAPGATQSVVRDIVAISPNDVWAVGSYVDSNSHSFAFSLHFDGSTWTEIPTPSPTDCVPCTNVFLWAVDALGPNDVWVCGSKFVQGPAGFQGSHMLVMHWDGSSWTVLDTPLFDGGGDILLGVTAIAPDDVWFFGDAINQTGSPDLAIALHYNGSTFELVPVPSVNPDVVTFGDGNGLHAASALAPNDIWAVGAASDLDYIPAPHSQIQHWNGSTWQNVPGPSPGLNHTLDAIVALAPDDIWAGGDYFDGTAYHGLALHYDGTSWTQVPIPGGVSEFVAFASNDIYAAGGAIMHWDGVSWTIVESFPQIDSATQSGLSAAGPCELWTGGRQIVNGQILNFTAHFGPVGTIGDLNGDGLVDDEDQALFCAAIGSSVGQRAFDPAADLNGDDTIDHADLAMFNAILTPCLGDVVSSATFQPPSDGVVDGADLAFLLGGWGAQPSCADIVSNTTFQPPPDGQVDGADLAYMLGAWGTCE